MPKLALYVHLKAKPGLSSEVASFLTSALPLAQQERDTVSWYAFAEDDSSFGIFDTFDTEAARQAHLDGPIAKALMAKALMAKAGELVSEPPAIHKIDILADKT